MTAERNRVSSHHQIGPQKTFPSRDISNIFQPGTDSLIFRNLCDIFLIFEMAPVGNHGPAKLTEVPPTQCNVHRAKMKCQNTKSGCFFATHLILLKCKKKHVRTLYFDMSCLPR